jgi:hypothetical protein
MPVCLFMILETLNETIISWRKGRSSQQQIETVYVPKVYSGISRTRVIFDSIIIAFRIHTSGDYFMCVHQQQKLLNWGGCRTCRPPLCFSCQSFWLLNGDVLCFLWGKNWMYMCYVEESRPPLWSSGQSSWLHNGDVLCFLWGTNWMYMLCRRKLCKYLT